MNNDLTSKCICHEFIYHEHTYLSKTINVEKHCVILTEFRIWVWIDTDLSIEYLSTRINWMKNKRWSSVFMQTTRICSNKATDDWKRITDYLSTHLECLLCFLSHLSYGQYPSSMSDVWLALKYAIHDKYCPQSICSIPKLYYNTCYDCETPFSIQFRRSTLPKPKTDKANQANVWKW